MIRAHCHPFAVSGVAAAMVCFATAAPAGAQTLRFTATTQGGIVGTGNTLGLSKAPNANGPGTEDSIGTFLSLGAGVDDMPPNPSNPWPVGTTNDWTKNGSSAVLTLPTESSVLYAELLWGGSTLYGGQDVSASLNTPVLFGEGGDTVAVAPDPSTAVNIATTSMQGFPVNYYLRSADVTAIVKAAGSGTYTVSGVPATEAASVNSLNAAGWTLVVAYEKVPAPTRNLSIFVGGSFVDEDATQDYTVSGFCAPPVGLVEGTVVVSAIEGDADLAGDQLLIAPTAAGPFQLLSGPNNPASNFFASQINGTNGELDTKGTFGAANHDAQNGVNLSGARQGWDVTTVPLSSANNQLQNGQTSAVLRTSTLGDSYVPILAALALDVNSPEFSASSKLVSSATVVELGDSFVLTATLENTGEVTAEDLVLEIDLPAGLALTSFETDGLPGDIHGAPVDASALAVGVAQGNLGVGATRVVTVELEASQAPSGSAYFVEASYRYGYAVCAGGDLFDSSFTQVAVIDFDDASTQPAGSGGAPPSTNNGSGGEETSGFTVGGFGPASPSASSGVTKATPSLVTELKGEGCGCGLPGRAPTAGFGVIAAACAALVLRRRRDRL